MEGQWSPSGQIAGRMGRPRSQVHLLRLRGVVMKQAQAMVLIVILIGTVGGIAFVRNWIFTRDTRPGGPVPELTIDFPITVAEGNPEYEVNGNGHHDFRFTNPNDQPLELGLNSKSCKCSKVEALILTAEDEKQIRNLYTIGSAVQTVATAAGPWYPLAPAVAAEGAVQQYLDRADHWQALEDAGAKVAKVPVRGSGYVRLSWQAKQLGPERLAA